ncbi:histidine--tRNA ligase [bacterium]|nr:histidine--tRNA ligase [bacterium]
MSIKPRLYRGMRDILPAKMLVRERLLSRVRETFELWGFAPFATPAIEYKEILAGKYGDMADRLIYSLEHKDGLALRYDLTVPLARAVAMLGSELPMPFKRYQIQEVWRAERAQPRQGRFREFLQCDVDTVGASSLVADAEILALSASLLLELGFVTAKTRLNHRELLRGLMEVSGFGKESEIEVCRIIDKLDKVGEDGVRKELGQAGYSQDSIESLMKIILREGEEPLDYVEAEFGTNARIARGIAELRRVMELAIDFGADRKSLRIDLSLSRGLDYYTGTIFESYVPEQPHIGSLTGGGRYDGLIGLFSGRGIPAVGITIGLDRIIAALEDAGRIDGTKSPTRVLVTLFDENLLRSSIEITRRLRANGVAAELYLEQKRLKKQFSYADSLGIPYVLIIGEDEVARSVYSLKDMATGKQRAVDFAELLKILSE